MLLPVDAVEVQEAAPVEVDELTTVPVGAVEPDGVDDVHEPVLDERVAEGVLGILCVVEDVIADVVDACKNEEGGTSC